MSPKRRLKLKAARAHLIQGNVAQQLLQVFRKDIRHEATKGDPKNRFNGGSGGSGVRHLVDTSCLMKMQNHNFLLINNNVFQDYTCRLLRIVSINLSINVGLIVGLQFCQEIKMLTDTKARRLKPDSKPISVGGAVGLYLRSGSNVGTGKFILRFVSPASGKRRDMGLGSYPSIGLAEARRLAGVARVKIAQGIDPISQRDGENVSADKEPKFPDFRDAALRVHADLAAGYRNAKHSAQWINTLITYAFPFIGDRQVNGLTTADFADLLRPIWLEKAETAGRVKQRCDRVMTWCIAHRFAMTNPVSAVDALLPKQPGKRERVQHHPAIPWRALPKSLSLLPASPTAGRDALFFLLFTAARSGEVRGAKWEEFDLERRVWSVPAVRMKAKMIHRVPLSAQACAVISRRLQFKTADPWVFSSQGSKPLSDMTLTKILRTARISSDTEGRIATAHGLRSSFRDWASENGYARDLAERALAHTIHNPTEAAYHRTDQLDQRVKLMQDWADYLAPFAVPTSKPNR